MALAGQLLGFVGLCGVGGWSQYGALGIAHTLVDASHYGFVATIVTGFLCFTERRNRALILCILAATLSTRLYLGLCLFDYASVFYFPEVPGLHYDYVFATLTATQAYRVLA